LHADIGCIRRRSPTMNRTFAALAALPCLLGGCSSPLIPDETVMLTSTISWSLADVTMVVAAVGITWLVVDPLAPNWEIHETKLSDTRYRIEMRKKRITTGGDGESIDLFHRQAEQITAAARGGGYTIMSWNEGVESVFPIARRWSRGVIEVNAPAHVGLQ
jgi:hypothetical protein